MDLISYELCVMYIYMYIYRCDRVFWGSKRIEDKAKGYVYIPNNP